MVEKRAWYETGLLLWIRRVLLFLLLGGLGLVLLLLAILLLPAGREAVLEIGLEQADHFVPGEITTGSIGWPDLGRLELRDVAWRVAEDDSLTGRAPGDTLAFVPHLILQISLEALREHELVLSELLVDAGPVDLPAIMALMPSQPQAAAAPDTSQQGGVPFLKRGSVPLAPSVELAGADLHVQRLRLPGGLTVQEAGLQAEAQLRADHAPRVVLKQGRVRMVYPSQQGDVFVQVDSLGLDLSADPQEQTFRLEALALAVPEAGPDTLRASWREAGGARLRWSGQGSWTETGVSLDLAGDQILPGPDHLRPLLPPTVPADLQGPLRGHVQLAVTVPYLAKPDPQAQLDLDFSSTPWLESFVLVGGYSGGQARVDTLDLAALGAQVQMQAVADTMNVQGTLHAAITDSTLLRRFGGEALAAADAELDLRLTVDGSWPIPAVDMDLQARLELPDLTLPRLTVRVQGDADSLNAQLAAPQGLWVGTVQADSLRVGCRARLAGRDSVLFGFDIGAFSPLGKVLAGGEGQTGSVRSVRLDSLIITALDSTMRTRQPARLTLGPAAGDWRMQDLLLEGGLGTLAVDGGQQKGGLALDLVLDLLLPASFLQMVAPSPLWQQNGGTDLLLRSEVDLEVDDQGPRFTGDARVGLVPGEDAPRMSADLDFQLAQEPDPGLGAELTVHMDDKILLRGSGLWPGRADLEAQAWVPAVDQGIQLTLPDQELELSLLNPYLPEEYVVDGILDIGFEVKQEGGTRGLIDLVSNSKVQGHLDLREVNAELPHSSRVALRAQTTIQGPLEDPQVEGEIRITSGFFNMPDIPPTLLPKQGDSYLWTAMAEADSLARETSGAANIPGRAPADTTAAVLPQFPDLDLRVRIPGSVILNGLGLNAELEGDIRVRRGQDRKGRPTPVLTGEMNLVNGTFKFMNHVFRPERTRVRFHGEAPPNPMLDILLAGDVSGYRIILEVTGYAREPEVKLRSEPMLDETDIAAVLLFGQPINNLDSEQRGRVGQENDPRAQLKQNLAAMALAFGGAGVQNQVANTLGVDMVDLGTNSAGGSTLMVGKYLTPRILLKYNKSLEKSGTYFMTLEYTLSRYFRLLSTYGQGEEGSGLELRWVRRN